MEKFVREALLEAQVSLENLLANATTMRAIADAGNLLATTFRNDGRVYSCGNGGSMSDAMHFAEELSGRFRQDRAGLGATAISDPSHITCTANDFGGFEKIFSRYVEAHGRAGDVLLAISTSGTSKNILAAAHAARARGVKVIGMTGKLNTPLEAASDIAIVTPGGAFSDRVQELHIKAIHIMIELVERQLFPSNYA